MKFARINPRQGRQQRCGPLLKLEGVASKQGQRARDTPLRSLGRL